MSKVEKKVEQMKDGVLKTAILKDLKTKKAGKEVKK